jgi:peptide/nickel transport system permease protein
MRVWYFSEMAYHPAWDHSTSTRLTVSVPMALAIIARETKRSRLLSLGTPIANRPDPVRVAEEMAWLDVLSGGRLEMGLVKGAPYEYILLRELLPNAWPAIVVEGSLRIAFAILLGAVLSFLGFGVQPPAADWGLMISTARDFVAAPWMAIAPGMAMSVTVIAVSVLGDGLREHLDPRLDGRR